ncbi:MAG: hypothetical protein NE334_10995 [Lentisphaeraceae bacterium]|nr:hypothetical protein [Lentisphaeraceae bacterium]
MKNGKAWTDEKRCDRSVELSGLYHQYIQLFLSTRFPGKDLWTVNLGHAGGKSSDALTRLEYDILSSKLDKSFVHFGMNDFRYFLYLDSKTTPPKKKKMHMQREYMQNMKTLVGGLVEKGIQVCLLSPTIYDEEARLSTKVAKNANAELSNYVGLSQNLSKELNTPFVNFYAPMLALTQGQQRNNPAWSITKDRVHPTERNGGGQFMAYQVLKQLGLDEPVYDLSLSWSGKVLKKEKANLVDLTNLADSLLFSTIETALPFPILKTDIGFKKYVPFQQELNRQILRVLEAPAGEYDLYIDKTLVGRYSSGELGNGVNLSANKKTPQYKMSHKLRDLVLFDKSVLEQRVRVMKNNIRFVLKDIKGVDWQDVSSVLDGIARFKKAKKKQGQKISGWQHYLVSTAEYSFGKHEQILKELQEIRQKLAKLPKVRMHSYRLERVTN